MNRDILDLFVWLDTEFDCLSVLASIDENTESLQNSLVIGTWMKIEHTQLNKVYERLRIKQGLADDECP